MSLGQTFSASSCIEMPTKQLFQQRNNSMEHTRGFSLEKENPGFKRGKLRLRNHDSV